ncbi:NAD(P)/FAD-dependent oxidoreductase [Hymenobacter aerilatus]|uniref:NADH:ubiquinone reductase (non-electrogenic) n=1 Tax=Hymenobacter aerilatus TaxID=2932251 RepID=A0A8T9SXU0_9BACT|nr:NAD(P)/FAD-dependent oxidoreductase [Hymenobacter aerilatus]UOR06537.1 NAD(P)/FAD-dependent oxidoreductase [Hymenobacter aerilatus]
MVTPETLSLNIPATKKPRVVIIGSGFGGVNLAKNLAGHEFQVVMFSKLNYFGFWPLLYQVATARLEPETIAEPIRKLFDKDYPDFHFRPVRVTNVDPAAKTVTTLVGELSYDYLVIATGTRTNYFGNDQVKQFAFPLKQVSDAVSLRSQLLQAFEQANMTSDPAIREQLLNVVVVGAGPTGVEMAGSIAEMRAHVLPEDYPGLDFSQMHIYLVEGLDRVLPPMSPVSSAHTHEDLEELGVIVKTNTLVENYDGQVVRLKNGEEIRARTLIWAAGVTGATVEGMPKETLERGRYVVNLFNQVQGYSDVFAIGDIALMRSEKWPNGHPGVAQPAIQQGVHLAKNLHRLRRNEKLEPFSYFDKGSLAITGRNRAVADLPGDKHLSGFMAWAAWLFVHIFYLIGFRSKLVVMANWVYRFFTYQSGTRVIISPFVRKDDVKTQEFMQRQQME